MIFYAVSHFVICQNSSPCPNHYQTPFVLLGKKKIELLHKWNFVKNKTEIIHPDLKMQ